MNQISKNKTFLRNVCFSDEVATRVKQEFGDQKKKIKKIITQGPIEICCQLRLLLKFKIVKKLYGHPLIQELNK